MPWKISKTGQLYQVATLFKNGSVKSVKSKGTTKKKAERQVRLLKALEHGFVPNK